MDPLVRKRVRTLEGLLVRVLISTGQCPDGLMVDIREALNVCEKCKGTGSWPAPTRQLCPDCKGKTTNA